MLAEVTVEYICETIENFKDCKRLMRSPSRRATKTVSLDSIDSLSSIMIFLSFSYPEETKSDDKLQDLCFEGLSKILHQYNHKKQVYVTHLKKGFLDPITPSTAFQRATLLEIMGKMDFLFTPIFDEAVSQAASEGRSITQQLLSSIRSSSTSYFDDYKSPLWNAHPLCYLNNSWTCLEMFYSIVSKRPSLHHLPGNIHSEYRPHYLYGSHESVTERDPILLPPLDVSYFDRYNPIRASSLQYILHPEEKQLLVQLTEQLKPLLLYIRVGYEGDLDELGRMHGEGVMHYSNGHIYEGQWQKGRRHGSGTYRFHIDVHAGIEQQLQTNRELNGNGRLNDNVYEGQWQQGLMWGRGTLRCASGDCYSGEWVAGRQQGSGKMTYKLSGDEYEGEWFEGFMHGQGVYRYSTGAMYTGELAMDLFEGKGTFLHSTGESYVGEWRNGKMHGRGIFRYRNGTTYEGEWENDNRVIM